MAAIEIFTDGACKGNPGVGGWGVLLRLGSVERELWGAERDTTNNRMELSAAIEGLNALTRACEVDLTTDSVYVRNGITKWIFNWKRKGWKTSAGKPVSNKELWQALDQAVSQHKKVQWHWIKGHSGHAENERADQLANRGVDQLRAQNKTSIKGDSGRQNRA